MVANISQSEGTPLFARIMVGMVVMSRSEMMRGLVRDR
jgi:hypothetical protein